MDELLKLIVQAGGLGVVGLGILYATKGAIATAVEQAGKHEIERLKGQLAGELERERQAFARELERERMAAARSLEQFKSQLTLEGEVSRQVAAGRVKVVGEMVEKCTELLVHLAAAPYLHENEGKALERLPALCSEYAMLVRHTSHLFPAAAADRLSGYCQVIVETTGSAIREATAEALHDAFVRVKVACERMSDYARSQLFRPDAEVKA